MKFTIIILLLAINYLVYIDAVFAFDVSKSKCRYIEEPEIRLIKSADCDTKLCFAKAECTSLTGPIILNFVCVVPKNSTKCPPPATCGTDKSIQITKPIILEDRHSQEGPSSDKGTIER
ncbi:MAG: hypothetical protein ISR65_14475 [Bacteriovoracaceae bacterium]|nr:hypothetical protein [Bacteriovoracaceae bacterium]